MAKHKSKNHEPEEKFQRPHDTTYDELVGKFPHLKGVIARGSWNYIGISDEKTTSFLRHMWFGNLKKNVQKKLWETHGSVAKDCVGIGKNKAVVAIGAGNSLNKNKEVLKELALRDAVRPWKYRDFIFIACNHQYKPLLDQGIVPDFVMLTDGSDVVYDQLCRDIPKNGQGTVLFAGLHCDARVIADWVKQGRMVRFYLTATPGINQVFERYTGQNSNMHQLMQGGNVLNTVWSMSQRFLHSSVYMCVGNDLSFEIKDTIDDQRKNYYADGNYSANLANKRDEANRDKRWAGFSLKKPAILFLDQKPRYQVELDLVGTSPTLWVYKTWMESNVVGNMSAANRKYHYYNCSEGGILGVCNKDPEYTDDGLKDQNKWFLIDEVCPRWHTMMLRDAAQQFILAKEIQNNGGAIHNSIGLGRDSQKVLLPKMSSWGI